MIPSMGDAFKTKKDRLFAFRVGKKLGITEEDMRKAGKIYGRALEDSIRDLLDNNNETNQT